MDLMVINKIEKKGVYILLLSIFLLMGSVFVELIYPVRKIQVIYNWYIFMPILLIILILCIYVLYSKFILKKRVRLKYLVIILLPILYVLKILLFH